MKVREHPELPAVPFDMETLLAELRAEVIPEEARPVDVVFVAQKEQILVHRCWPYGLEFRWRSIRIGRLFRRPVHPTEAHLARRDAQPDEFQLGAPAAKPPRKRKRKKGP